MTISIMKFNEKNKEEVEVVKNQFETKLKSMQDIVDELQAKLLAHKKDGYQVHSHLSSDIEHLKTTFKSLEETTMSKVLWSLCLY